MYKEGTVAIWLGYFRSMERLQEYLQVNYTEGADFIDSRFERDFNVEYFDEEMSEIDYFSERKNKFSDILQEHSYWESIIPNYYKIYPDELDKGYNSLILLYDYSYTGLEKQKSFNKDFINFIGNIDFDRNI